MPIEIKDECKSVETLALIDSGAGGKFINRKYAERLGLPIQTLERPIMARNVDGTLNKTGTITSYVDLVAKIDGRTMGLQLLVTGLGNQKIILGFPWLNEHNLDIDWKTRKFKWRSLRPLKVKRYHDNSKKQLEYPIRTVKTDGNLEIKLHSDMARIPTRGSPDVAGYDLYSAVEKVIPARGKMLIDTQISIATPPGTYGRIAPRSGLAAKNMITTGAGVIDADYRGMVLVLLFNHSDEDFKVKQGDRIAQLILEKIATPTVEQVENLDETTRGNQGFGLMDKPQEEEKDILIAMVGKTEEGDEVWMATTEELLEEDEIWIITKTSNSIEFHLLHDVKKDNFLLTEQIPEEYHEFIRVFDKEEANRFPKSQVWDHKIELKEGFQPKSFKTYNLTPAEQKELDTFLKENLEKGYIRPSKSPMATPFFFVKKKDRKLRPCQDYWYLNEWTVKNTYPLPLISELMDKIKDGKYFTKLDIRWGYNNVRIKEGDEWKATFKTNRGLYEPTVMFFGMCNSPATFQAMMDDIFEDLIEEGIVIIYMDDMFLSAKTKEQLRENTRRVLQRLMENDLYLKPKKCEFCKEKIEWLGMVIQEGKITMDPGKLRGIQDWPAPTTVKQVWGFLGFGNFYRRFIWGFSEVTRPLNELLKKDRKFEWTAECQRAFEDLKTCFTSKPILVMPDQKKPFQIECDASKYASGAVLTQLDSNGDRHPCAFISKTFSPAERNYEIYD